MFDEYMVLGFIALPISLAGLATATVGFLYETSEKLKIRRELARDYGFAIIEDKLHEELRVVEKKVNYRHSIHCPKCGRFAKSIKGMAGASDCKHHGAWLRTPEGPLPLIVETVDISPIDNDLSMALAEPVRVPDELDTGTIVLPNLKTCSYCYGQGEIEVQESEFYFMNAECPICTGLGIVDMAMIDE